jgi:Fungal specific transcription factor domain
MYQQYLTPEALSDFVNIYWNEFHIQYPILHRPTTQITRGAHLPLFVSMMTIGMAIGGDDKAHELAVMMHEELRWQIYSSKSFKHPAKLWEMQTLLLREIFDKMLSGRHQHEMAHTVIISLDLTDSSFMERYSR